MAGHNRYTALLDANVLYSVAISDALMEVAATGIYAAKWSKAIDQEWIRNLAKNRNRVEADFYTRRDSTKSDDPKKKKQDAKLVNIQPHEQKYLQRTTGKSAAEVAKATKSAGPSRKAVVKKLSKDASTFTNHI